MKSTMTDQIDQIEKPTCSVATDQTRLRRATSLLPASHAAVSSGSQSRMTRVVGAVRARNRFGRSGARGAAAATVPVVLVPGVLPVVVLTGSPPWLRGPLRERVPHARKPVLHGVRPAVTPRLHPSHAPRQRP